MISKDASKYLYHLCKRAQWQETRRAVYSDLGDKLGFPRKKCGQIRQTLESREYVEFVTMGTARVTEGGIDFVTSKIESGELQHEELEGENEWEPLITYSCDEVFWQLQYHSGSFAIAKLEPKYRDPVSQFKPVSNDKAEEFVETTPDGCEVHDIARNRLESLNLI